MIPYIQQQLERYGPLGLKLNGITRHMLGLMAGLPGARAFRQLLSDSRRLAEGNPELLLEAAGRMRKAA
jgi:tRNA-dihydrouridine synthase A